MSVTTSRLKPSKKQEDALAKLSYKSPIEVVLYGGAAGGGKTWLGAYWHVMRRIKYAGTTGGIMRSELKDIKLTTLVAIRDVCRSLGLIEGVDFIYNQQDSVIRWFNGSRSILMELQYRPSDADYNYLGSYLFSDLFIEEAAACPGRGIEVAISRVRENLVGGVPKTLLTCNPSKGWLYNNFYKPHKDGRLHEKYSFIQALLSDNTEMRDREVYESALNRMSERDRRRLKDGDWDFDDAPDLLFETESMLQMFVSPPDNIGTEKKYITCDPAAMGNDRTVIGLWLGLYLVKIIELKHKHPHEVADIIRSLASENGVRLSSTAVDSDGLGIGVQGILKCKKFMNGAAAKDSANYANLKAECYFKLSEYVRDNKIFVCVSDKRELIMKELDMVRDRTREDKKRAVSGKDEIKQAIGYSPDYADMMMMRMYFEIYSSSGKYAFGSI